MKAQEEFPPELERQIVGERLTFAYENLSFAFVAATAALSLFAAVGDNADLLGLATPLAFLSVAFFWVKNVKVSAAAGNVPVRISALIFLPWLVFLAATSVFSAAFPQRAEFAFAMNVVPLLALFVAEQQSRSDGKQVALLAFLLVGSGIEFCAELFAKYFGADSDSVGADVLATIGVGANVTAGICVLFVALALLLRRGIPGWARAICFYCVFVAIAAILAIGDFASWIAVCVGAIALSFFAVKNLTRRIAGIVVAVCAMVIYPLACDNELPVLLKIDPPANANFAGENFSGFGEYEIPKAALEIFAESPVLGAGSGAFPEEFQRHVAASQWQIRPENAANLYLNILAENGALGFVLLFAPLAWLFWRGARMCAKAPWREKDESRRSRLSGTRAALSPALACGSAFVAYFLLAFPPVSVGTFVVLGVFGGVVLRELHIGKFARTPALLRPRFAIVAGVIVVAAMMSLVLPSVLARMEFCKGERELAAFMEHAFSKEQVSEFVAAPGETDPAKEHFLKAVSLRNNDADSWVALAQVYALSANLIPSEAVKFSKLIGIAADNALAAAPNFPNALFWKAVAQALAGDNDAALETLKRVEALAAKNAPLMLQVAELHRLISPVGGDALRIYEWLNAVFPESPYIEQERALMELFREKSNSAAGDNNPDDNGGGNNAPSGMFEI